MLYFVVLFTVLVASQAVYIPLSPEQKDKVSNWTEKDGNLWQLSGQFEGDIILTKDQEEILKNGAQNRNGITDSRYRWPNRWLVYDFDGSVPQQYRDQINNALTEFRSRTCVGTRMRNGNDRDYVIVTTNGNEGCFSMVGRIGGRQRLNLAYPGCFSKGIIIHEFLHAFGFFHMQSDPIRDSYVQILWQNIQDGRSDQFTKYTSGVSSFGYIYDYASVMHYDDRAFSKNGQPTIVTTNPRGAKIGQRGGLSNTDAAKVNRMYGC